MCMCLLSACSDDDDSRNGKNDIMGDWYLEDDSNDNYSLTGFESGGTGWHNIGAETIRISWTFNDNILWTINSENYTTDKKGYAEIVDGKLYWCGDVYTRSRNGSTGGSTSGEQASDWAPSSMVGKIICWNEHNSDGTGGNSNVRVKFDNSTDMSTNFSDWCTYSYKKQSSKTAHLNFMAPQRVAAVIRTFQYDLDLEFKSANEFEVKGTLKVNYLSGPNIGSTAFQKFTGTGKFVDSLTGSDNGNTTPSTDTPQTPNPGKAEDIAKFTGVWEENIDKSQPGWSMKMMSYTFKEDGSFIYGYALGVGREFGTFTCTSSSISLYVDSKVKRSLTLQNGTLVDKTNNKTFTKK